MKRSVVLSLVLGVTVVLFQNCAKDLPDMTQNVLSSQSPGGCVFNGSTIPNGASVPAYSVSSGSTQAACTSSEETRTCNDGRLSGTFSNASCTVVGVSAANISLTLATSATNYNIFAAAGSPTSAANVVLTINSGVTVSATNPSVVALSTGNFPSGSTLQIVNNGSIYGAGGSGGGGGLGARGYPTALPGSPGGPGGPALSLGFAITLTNNGLIAGGGGGGGGGGGCNVGVEFGSGGGGAGSAPGAGGAGSGIATGPGSPGGGGSLTTGGAAGVGGSIQGFYCNYGGAGGGLGQAGTVGMSVSSYSVSGVFGGAGGAAGAGILKNGFGLNLISGGASILGPVQ
ncbi:MAG: hypothetical protein ACXVA9_03435 [Bdellovibrionales bacterium]